MSQRGQAVVSKTISLEDSWWNIFEPIHGIVYFAPDIRRAVRAAGAPGFWPGYFGSRLFPLQTENVVLATGVLYGFSESMVRKYLPSLRQAEGWYDARLKAAGRLLEGLGEAVGFSPIFWEAAAGALQQEMQGLEYRGRPLFAAHRSLDWPEDPILSVWHAATLYREYRGDGHVHVLVEAGLSPCESFILAATWRRLGDHAERMLIDDRGWPRESVLAAYDRLNELGYMHRGELTDTGAAARAEIERATERMAVLSGNLSEDPLLVRNLRSLCDSARAMIPAVNPIGVAGMAASDGVVSPDRSRDSGVIGA